MEPEKIKSMVNEIRSCVDNGEKDEVIKNRYLAFWQQYPKVYNAAVNRDFPLTFLSAMLIQLDKLNKKEIDLDGADSNVYGDLRKTYIDPYFPN